MEKLNDLQQWEKESEERRRNERRKSRNGSPAKRGDNRVWFEKLGKEKKFEVLSRMTQEERDDYYRRKSSRKPELRTSVEDFLRLVSDRNGKCEICGNFYGEDLCVDHDHITGSFRGLLCPACNRALGYFRDNPGNLEKGAKYLMKHLQKLLDSGEL